MTNFAWTVNTLERHTATGIVSDVFFSVKASDDIYSAGVDGKVPLPEPAEGDAAIPYSELTEEVVVGWVKAVLGGDEKVAEVHQSLQAQLDEQRSPSKANGTPW